MRTFNFLSFSLSIISLLFLLLVQIPQSFASDSNSKVLHKIHNEPQFLQRRELNDLYYPCEAQSTCTKSISTDDTILLQLDPNAVYNLNYVINSANEDLYINFESQTMISALIYLSGSSSSGQIIFSTDNFLLKRTYGWTADILILKGTLASNFGSTLTIAVTNPNAEEQTVRISFSYGGVPTLGVALACIGGGLLFLIAICCFIRRRKNRSSTNLARRSEQSVQPASNNSPNESTVTPYLTEENMDNYFPEVRFEYLKSTFVQTSCTICLEDMTKGMDCRQLYCEHIFHSECIKLWLKNQLPKNQACCPNCNKDMLQENSRQ